MPKITVPDAQKLPLLVKNPPVGDPAIPAVPIALGVTQEFAHDLIENGVKIGAASLSIGVETNFAVVNDAKDPDPEELFDLGEKPEPVADDPEAAPEISPPIQFDVTKAYIVLTDIAANGKINSTVTAGSLGIGLDASAMLSCAFCKEFPREMPLVQALTDTCAGFKSLFDPAELIQIASGETATLGVGGKLKLTLELSPASISDALSSGVQSVLAKTIPVEVAVTAPVKLALSFEVNGGYRIHARQGAANTVQFIVRKTSSRIVGVDGTIGVVAKIKEGSALAQYVSAAFEKVTGLPAALADKAQGAAGIEQLTDAEKTLVTDAVEKLHLQELGSDAWNSLKKALGGVEKKVKELLLKKAEASFTYTWRRTTRHAAVARFTLSSAALNRHHANLLRLDLDAIMAEKDDAASGVSFDRFLGQKVARIDVGYGFGFSWGAFTLLKGWDARSTRYIWERNLDGNVQVAFLGKRGYEATWLNEKSTHVVELDASMPRFSAPPPRPSDFEVAWHVGFSWQDRTFQDIAREIADTGLLIGALEGADVSVATVALYDAGLPTRTGGTATVSLKVPAAATSAVLAAIAGSSLDDLFAKALARAMPCGKFGEAFEARRNIERRMSTYTPIWADFLKGGDFGLDALGRLAADRIDPIDRKLARLETEAQTLWGWNVRGIVRNNGDVAAVQRGVFGLRLALLNLQRRGESALGYEVFEATVRGGSPCWSARFGARMFASLLLLAAEREPGLLQQIGRKVSFAWQDTQEHILEFKQGETT